MNERGYKHLAELGNPIQMKTFICRVIEKIHCKVQSGDSLDAFVPYYSSLASNETYGHLEKELTEICHAGDKWAKSIRPKPKPAKVEGPCKKDPAAAKSAGNSVSLDEAGYQGIVQLESDPNMQRFICRVVDKIKCSVTDASSLAKFVPYYSSLTSHETYAHLQEELGAMCASKDNKWIMPREDNKWVK